MNPRRFPHLKLTRREILILCGFPAIKLGSRDRGAARAAGHGFLPLEGAGQRIFSRLGLTRIKTWGARPGLLWAMRYYMHINNGGGFVEDEEGRDLADDKTARSEAIAAARDVMAGDLRDGHIDLTSSIQVENEAHQPLFTIVFADAVAIRSSGQGG